MNKVTSKDLRDKANHETCFCGNKTIIQYSSTDYSGEPYCPQCTERWLGDQINALKELLFELSGQDKFYVSRAINREYAQLMNVDAKDLEYDYSEFKPTK